MNGSGDEQVFETLARQVVEPVRRYLARRTDEAIAADVLSEVLLVMWRRLEDIPVGEPLPWVYVVARNCLHNAQRSAARQQRLAAKVAVLDPSQESDLAHHEQDPDALGGWQLEPEQVRAAIPALSPASAEVVRLLAWEGLSPAQIAVVVGSSANAVSIRLHRAKEQLVMALGAGVATGQVGPTGSRGSTMPTGPSGRGKATDGAGQEAGEGPSPGQRHGPPADRERLDHDLDHDWQRSAKEQGGRTT